MACNKTPKTTLHKAHSISSPTGGISREQVKLRVCLQGEATDVCVCVRMAGGWLGKCPGFAETKLFGKPPSCLLSLAGLPDAARHRRDERRALAAAVFRLQEGHFALGRQLLHCFVHDGGEAAGHGEGEADAT